LPPDTMENLIEVTDENFDELIEKNESMVIDCWAEWCGPCKMIEPLVEELATEFKGSVTFATLDVDSNPNTSNNLGIMAIPTLLYFSGGELVDQTVGVVPKETIEEIIRNKL
jgi:thioredoxin 1